MFNRTNGFLVALLAFAVAPAAAGQSRPVQAPPPMVPIIGTLFDGKGQPQTAQTIVTISVYEGQTDRTPLWQEQQMVTPDARGRYSLTLGAATQSGLPTALFTGGDARWLGIQADGLPEQERILLTSVAYALKSGDANTLGGLPASAFRLAGRSIAGPSTRTPRRTDSVSSEAGATAASTGDPTSPTDQVIADDLIVQGSLCAGLDCVDAENFGFDTIRLKENNTRINFDDTSASAGFATNNWQIRANDSGSGGTNFLGFVDQGDTGNSETGTIVFRVDAGAPANALKVAAPATSALARGRRAVRCTSSAPRIIRR